MKSVTKQTVTKMYNGIAVHLYRNAFAFAFAFFFPFALQAQAPPAPAPDNIDYSSSKTILQWKNSGWQPERVGVGRTAVNSSRAVHLGNAIEPVFISATYAISSAELTAGTFPAGVSGVLAGNIYTISGTPTANGTFDYTITVAGDAGKSGTVKGRIIVCSLEGRLCFDVTQTDGGTECGNLPGRTGVFTETARTYTLIGSAAETEFYVIDDALKTVKSLTQNGSNTVIVNFADDVNDIVAGKKETFTLLAKVKDNSNTIAQISLAVKIQDCSCCGAYTEPDVWKAFMCHNIGADYTLDPFIPAAGIHGDKYKWGTKQVALTQDQDQASAAIISGWTSATYGTPPALTAAGWDMSTANPCPAGFRIPTNTEWTGVINNNGTWLRTGNFTNSEANYTSGVKAGSALFLPTAGNRHASDGSLDFRGISGYYWTSTAVDTSASYMYLTGTDQGVSFGSYTMITFGRNYGFSVRCIAE